MRATDLYESCLQCPRKCGVNRCGSKHGFCGETVALKIASAGLHFGEEPPVTVFNGSGTIFFTGCTLRCSFCQNYQISQQGMGADVDRESFVKICLRLQELGAENINLVTGSHHIPMIAEFLDEAKSKGLSIPVAWNSSAYESVEMLERLRGLVDLWLPDLKSLNPDMSGRLFGARDYPDVASDAILWMIENSPLKIVEMKKSGETKEKMLSGVIVRHLFMPGRLEDTADVLSWLKENANGKSYISLMSQYTPVPFKEDSQSSVKRQKSLTAFENRLVSETEDSDIRDLIEAYDFDYLFYQELSDDTSWLPDFNRTQPFSNALAKPCWHWRDGFLEVK